MRESPLSCSCNLLSMRHTRYHGTGITTYLHACTACSHRRYISLTDRGRSELTVVEPSRPRPTTCARRRPRTRLQWAPNLTPPPPPIESLGVLRKVACCAVLCKKLLHAMCVCSPRRCLIPSPSVCHVMAVTNCLPFPFPGRTWASQGWQMRLSSRPTDDG